MNIIRTVKKTLIAFGVIVGLVACGGSDFTVNTKFNDNADVQKGAVVYLNNEIVGEVIDSSKQEGNTLVTISLKPEAVANIGSDAAVVINTNKTDNPLELHNRTNPVEVVVLDGQSLKGFDSMFQLGAWMIGDSIKLGSGTVSEYLETFQDYLQSDKFDQDKQQIKEKYNSAKSAAGDAFKQIEKDISQAAEELSASQLTAAEIISQLGDELAPAVKEMSGNGAELLAQVEEFASNLESGNSKNKQAGEAFLLSLLEAMDKLNSAIEEGADQEVSVEPDQQQDL